MFERKLDQASGNELRTRKPSTAYQEDAILASLWHGDDDLALVEAAAIERTAVALSVRPLLT